MFQCPQLVRRICPNVVTHCVRWASINYNQDALCAVAFATQTENKQLYSTLTFKGLFGVGKVGDNLPAIYQPSREYAARKGTRAKRAAKKVKGKVLVKQPYIFKNLRRLALLPYKSMRPIDDSHKSLPVDDVYFTRNFRAKNYEFEEVIQMLRETHHPTVYNVPNAPLYLRINLDMKYPNRATKCMDGWRSVIEMKHPFLLEGMTQPSVLAFCIEDVDYIDDVAKNGGADLAGGKELIKAIQAGELNTDEYEYLVAHPNVVPELTVIRGLIKRKFPAVKSRTISTDLVAEVKRLKAGMKVHVAKDDREPEFAFLEAPIGTLDMDGLYENFKSVVEDTIPRRTSGKSPRDFVISCVLKTPGNGFEEFNVDISSILQEFETQKQKKAVAED